MSTIFDNLTTEGSVGAQPHTTSTTTTTTTTHSSCPSLDLIQVQINPIVASSSTATTNTPNPTNTPNTPNPTNPTPTRIGLNDFELLTVIGKGGFGKVVHCRHRGTATTYAMKILSKEFLIDSNNVSYMLEERDALMKVNHPFVVKLLAAFQTKLKVYLVMEYIIGGELFSRLEDRGFFLPGEAQFYAAEAVLAVEYLHGIGICHRDLKPENCLLDVEGHLRITDFGFAKGYTRGDNTKGETNWLKTMCGTDEYMAPEMVKGLKYGYAVDWWALGCLVFEMVVGKAPFKGKNRKKLHHAILNTKLKMPSHLTSECCSLLKGLLRRNPEQRFGAAKSTMFKTKGVAEIKQHSFFRRLDWKKLYSKTIEPPFRPQVMNQFDTSNFDEEFVEMSINSPALSPQKMASAMKKMKMEDGGVFSIVEQGDTGTGGGGGGGGVRGGVHGSVHGGVTVDASAKKSALSQVEGVAEKLKHIDDDPKKSSSSSNQNNRRTSRSTVPKRILSSTFSSSTAATSSAGGAPSQTTAAAPVELFRDFSWQRPSFLETHMIAIGQEDADVKLPDLPFSPLSRASRTPSPADRKDNKSPPPTFEESAKKKKKKKKQKQYKLQQKKLAAKAAAVAVAAAQTADLSSLLGVSPTPPEAREEQELNTGGKAREKHEEDEMFQMDLEENEEEEEEERPQQKEKNNTIPPRLKPTAAAWTPSSSLGNSSSTLPSHRAFNPASPAFSPKPAKTSSSKSPWGARGSSAARSSNPTTTVGTPSTATSTASPAPSAEAAEAASWTTVKPSPVKSSWSTVTNGRSSSKPTREASRRTPPGPEEKRYDQGELFTKKEFISYYGFHSGLQRWQGAKQVPKY